MRILGLRPVFSESEINVRLDRLAAEIDSDYAGKDIVAVCVLKGAFMFFSGLVRRLHCRPRLDFVRLSSYGSDTEGHRVVCTKDVELPLQDKDVLIVEDIVDTGRSMDFLMRRFATRGARSVRLAALLDKDERRVVDVHVDYKGFDLPHGFLVGYGLDYAEQYRELPSINELLYATD